MTRRSARPTEAAIPESCFLLVLVGHHEHTVCIRGPDWGHARQGRGRRGAPDWRYRSQRPSQARSLGTPHQRRRRRSGSSTPSTARTLARRTSPGEIAAALMAKADELLASPPNPRRRRACQQIGLPACRLLVGAAPSFTTGQGSQQQRRLRAKLAEGTSPSQTGSTTARRQLGERIGANSMRTRAGVRRT